MTEISTDGFVLAHETYGVLLTGRGGGYSAWRGLALTRWQPDPTVERPGMLWYVRDRMSGAYWSTQHAALQCADDYAILRCAAQEIELTCRVSVLAGVAGERRTIHLTNRSREARELDLTTYAELCLNTPAADAAHPAFSKLFVQTEYDDARGILLASRRLRSPQDQPMWVAQRIAGASTLSIETDRARFIGRTRSLVSPQAMDTAEPLSGTIGSVLDPVFSARTAVRLEPGESSQFDLLLCAGESRSEVIEVIDRAAGAAGTRRKHVGVLGLPVAWRDHIKLGRPDPVEARPLVSVPAQPVAARAQHGQFSEDGTEYLLEVGPALAPTPQPWINVIANEHCGCLTSELGAGYTWAANSREYRITPWSNDPVTDAPGEALYVRDDETGEYWSLLPGPVPADANYQVRHGFGYSIFAHTSHSLAQQATVFVPPRDPVKITRVRIQNTSARTRRLSLICYAELVLGGAAAETRGRVQTTIEGNVILARNPAGGEFSERVAFAAAVSTTPLAMSATTSRRSFIGRGTVVDADALGQQVLDGRAGADVDPCAALLGGVTLEPGATLDCAFLLGSGADEAATRTCLDRYATIESTDEALQAIRDFWQELLGAVQVRTPVPALNLMFNGWLAYQNLACRMWGRSAFYQSGGAFGFRDQLQDSSALLYLDPGITRAQILLHAAHQFVEGDVLHWWHPPTSKGIRTRFSDDLLWLPQVTHFYLATTGDASMLDEDVGLVTAEPLGVADDERFVWPRAAAESASLYEHCCRALDRSLTAGERGLPLMGVGDWNDGMNRVGREGKGESVWLGFFLFDILTHWIPICEQRGDAQRARSYRVYRRGLHSALNDAGWDGQWYRRAYYDSGVPLGSAQNDECRIDALAQAWAVISRAAPEPRARQCLAEMKAQLVDESAGLIRLLTPAFDRTPHDPGYIKGYVPGVRENGGQYTHAALWAVRALAEHGEADTAARLLEMLSPITRSQDAAYRGEPYVIAADVYGEPPHTGRAGWTWYTGSAGWMYRVLLESILGFELINGDVVKLRPCLPRSWPGYSLRYRFPGGTVYHFEVERTDTGSSTSEGAVRDGAIVVPLVLDGGEHTVRVRAGQEVRPRYRPRSSDAPLLRTTSA